MPYRKNIVCLTFMLFLLFVTSGTLFGNRQDDPAVRAIQLFDSGNFAEAERAFGSLLAIDGDNPMTQYYYGAARTENGHYGDAELKLLLRSGKIFTADRLHYYLGIQYHARHEWDQALKSYNQFRATVPVSEQLQVELPLKIQYCYDRINPFKSPDDPVPERMTEAPLPDETVLAEPAQPDSGTLSNQEKLPDVAALTDSVGMLREGTLTVADSPGAGPWMAAESVQPVVPSGRTSPGLPFERAVLPDLPGVEATTPLPGGSRIHFRINEQVTYLFTSQFRTGEGLELFTSGSLKSDELEKMNEAIDRLRRAYGHGNAGERAVLGEKILAMEQDSYRLQDEVNRLLASARMVENDWWLAADETTLHNFLVEQEKVRTVLAGGVVKPEPVERGSVPLTEISSDLFAGRMEAPEESSPRSAMGQLVYKIQIGAFSRGIPASGQRR